MMTSKPYVIPCLVLFLFMLASISCSDDIDELNQLLIDDVDTDQNLNEDSDEEQTQDGVSPFAIGSFLKIEDFNLPPQNADGFTILGLSQTSRILYVNSITGEDGTAEIYTANSTDIGTDYLNPPTTIKAFATLSEARKQMREGEPDIMLLAANSVWNETLDVSNGKSATERAIYAAYGKGARPELRTGEEMGIKNGQLSNIIISGIKFWAHTRDDEGSYFEGFKGSLGFNFFTREDRRISNVLIEDCMFRSYEGNVLTGTEDSGRKPMDKVALRRNIISGNYSNRGHSQGLFYIGKGATEGTAVVLEGNIFDHNGWRIQRFDLSGMGPGEGQATFFNHNTYFANAKGILFKENIFLRASSIHNKWTANNGEGSSTNITLTNNLYVDGEIGVSMGGNEPGPRRFKNIFISNNVFTNIGNSRPTNRVLSWGLDVVDWDSGEVNGNLFLHQKNELVTNVYGIAIRAETAMRNVSVVNNFMYGLNGSSNAKTGLLRVHKKGSMNNVQIFDNYFYGNDQSALVSLEEASGYIFSNNSYSSDRGEEWFGNGDTWIDMDAWRNTIEKDAKTFTRDAWQDPERNIESYLNFIGKGNSMNAFIEALYKQSRAEWNPDLSATEINKWIREGFR